MSDKELIDDRYCFVCGEENPEGLNLDWETTEEGPIRTVFVPGKRFQGWKDVVHGGILSTILDETMVNHRVYQGTPVVSVELSVRFREPGTIGEPIEFSGNSSHRKGRLYKGEARAQQGDTLIAEASGKLMKVQPEEATS